MKIKTLNMAKKNKKLVKCSEVKGWMEERDIDQSGNPAKYHGHSNEIYALYLIEV